MRCDTTARYLRRFRHSDHRGGGIRLNETTSRWAGLPSRAERESPKLSRLNLRGIRSFNGRLAAAQTLCAPAHAQTTRGPELVLACRSAIRAKASGIWDVAALRLQRIHVKERKVTPRAGERRGSRSQEGHDPLPVENTEHSYSPVRASTQMSHLPRRQKDRAREP